MMKLIRGVVVLSALVVAAAASAQIAEPYDADAAAQKALAKLVKTYRALPALQVTTTLKVELIDGEMKTPQQEVTIKLTYGGRTTGRAVIKDYACLFVEDVFTASHAKNEDAYYRETFDGSPYWSFLSSFQDLPYPHLGLLWGEDSIDDVLMQLQPQTPMIVPTALTTTMIDGVKHQVIELTSPHGVLRLVVDPTSKLLASAEHEITGGPLTQTGVQRHTTYAFEYEVPDEPFPATHFAFDPERRQRVDLLAALAPPREPVARPGGGGAQLAGVKAPPFVLATADGDAIDLSDLEGKVVVLDFWATWCAPCRRALPALHEVAAWAKKNRLPVEVITINVWEARDPKQNTPDARLKSVNAFWTKNNYTLPVAMDYTDEVAAAYGVQGIPATFVIRSDGVVHDKPHATAESLKESIQDALAELEVDPG